jgi:hypothetical protein
LIVLLRKSVKRLMKSSGRSHEKPKSTLIRRRTHYEREGFKHAKMRENVSANYGHSQEVIFQLEPRILLHFLHKFETLKSNQTRRI